MTFARRPHPASPSRPRSEAQQVASARNFRIFQLRGLWSFSFNLTGERRVAMQALVDQELVAFGAEAETGRRARLVGQAAEAARADDEEFAELPF